MSAACCGRRNSCSLRGKALCFGVAGGCGWYADTSKKVDFILESPSALFPRWSQPAPHCPGRLPAEEWQLGEERLLRRLYFHIVSINNQILYYWGVEGVQKCSNTILVKNQWKINQQKSCQHIEILIVTKIQFLKKHPLNVISSWLLSSWSFILFFLNLYLEFIDIICWIFSQELLPDVLSVRLQCVCHSGYFHWGQI